MIEVNIINSSRNKLPEYKTEGSVGMDLMANLDEDIKLKPLERVLVPTGIFIELPENHEAQIRPRSGLAIKHGITVLNTPGTIDFDYLGQIKVILVNLSNEDFIVKHGDRIAQMVINKIEKARLTPVLFFETVTERNEGGFGHTGV
jgi:dUTP pyrophosphatase